MKKLLGLLGTTIITGSGMMGLVGNALNSAKNEINYQQTNNLESLSRNKREQNDYSFINNDGMFYNYPTSSDFYTYYNERYRININNKIYFTDRGDRGQIILKEEDDSSGKLFIISNNINNDINGVINRFSMSSLRNELYFNSEKGIYKYDNEKKQIVLVYNYEITSNISILNEEFYFVSKNNICKYNIFESKLEIIKNIENNTINKTIIKNNNIIFQSGNNDTYGYLSFNFQDTNCFKLLQEWVANFKIWENEINRQLKEDFSSFSLEQKRSWKGDKNNELKDKIHSLKQDLLIITNSQAIEELENKFQNLQNNLMYLNNTINDLDNQINKINSSNSSNSSLTWCANITAGVAAVSAPVPIVGTLIAAISGLISVGCLIANSDMTITTIEYN